MCIRDSGTAAQHADRPWPFFMNVPGLKVIAPATASDAKGMLKAAIRDDDPVLMFEEINLWGKKEEVSADDDFLIPIGKADIKREGGDVTIVSIAGVLHEVLPAAAALAKEGIEAEGVDPRTLRPPAAKPIGRWRRTPASWIRWSMFSARK